MSLLSLLGLLCIAVALLLIPVLLFSGTSRSISQEESQLMQELYQGLTRMEERVESLETLLLERERMGRQL